MAAFTCNHYHSRWKWRSDPFAKLLPFAHSPFAQELLPFLPEHSLSGYKLQWHLEVLFFFMYSFSAHPGHRRTHMLSKSSQQLVLTAFSKARHWRMQKLHHPLSSIHYCMCKHRARYSLINQSCCHRHARSSVAVSVYISAWQSPRCPDCITEVTGSLPKLHVYWPGHETSHDLAIFSLSIELMHGLTVTLDDLHNTFVVMPCMFQQTRNCTLQLVLQSTHRELWTVSCTLLVIRLCSFCHQFCILNLCFWRQWSEVHCHAIIVWVCTGGSHPEAAASYCMACLGVAHNLLIHLQGATAAISTFMWLSSFADVQQSCCLVYPLASFFMWHTTQRSWVVRPGLERLQLF